MCIGRTVKVVFVLAGGVIGVITGVITLGLAIRPWRRWCASGLRRSEEMPYPILHVFKIIDGTTFWLTENIFSLGVGKKVGIGLGRVLFRILVGMMLEGSTTECTHNLTLCGCVADAEEGVVVDK